MPVWGSRFKSAGPARTSIAHACPTLSHVAAASETAKIPVDWELVSPVSLVSLILKLIAGIIERKVGKACTERKLAKAPCAETGGTGATNMRL